MIKTTSMLLEELENYANPKAKLSRMAKQGTCFPIVKGLYETDRNVPSHLLAGSIVEEDTEMNVGIEQMLKSYNIENVYHKKMR